MTGLTEGMIVRCNTEEKARKFLNECKKQGIHDSYYDGYTDWEVHNKNMCYRIVNKNRINYGNYSRYKDKNKITEFDDLFKIECKVEVGDIVKVVNKFKQYNSYVAFIMENMPERLEDFRVTGMIPVSKEYKILHISNHLIYNDKLLCIVEDLNTKEIYIIEDKGVELVRKSNEKECKVYDFSKQITSNIDKSIVNNPCVIVILKTGEKGIARCLPRDKFDELKGYEIAYRKAQIKKLKNELKVLTK